MDTSVSPFDEGDSDVNLRWMEAEEPGIDFRQFMAADKDKIIKGGSLPKLIEKATCENVDQNYVADFITTFHTFTTPNELLFLLSKR